MENRELPSGFLDKMKQLLGESYEAYLASFSDSPVDGLRVNTLKTDPEAFLRLAENTGFQLTKIPWITNGFYYNKEERLSRHPWYYAGLYYLQEPSAMTPASLLPVVPGDRVLDLCAAPGGKSTELAARLDGQGLLFANDISHSRAKALLKNLELSGAGPICVASETPEKLSGCFPAFFDKILVDAPCSGEGMFRRDHDMVKSYAERGPEYYSPLQRAIVTGAVKMLAPGGMLLYSTCTFDEQENEGTIRFLLEQYPEMHLVEIPKKEGFEPGIGLSGCVRLFPHRIKGEGHFIALLQKDGRKPDDKAAETLDKTTISKKERVLLEPVLEFLRQIDCSWDETRLFRLGEQVYYLPQAFAGANSRLLSGIRYLRTGLLLGELKKARFEPSQALAMNLKAEQYPNCLLLSSSDERVIRYLKGETIPLISEESAREGIKGWTLVCVDGYPLGWGRIQNENLKNKYYPGWRWQ